MRQDDEGGGSFKEEREGEPKEQDAEYNSKRRFYYLYSQTWHFSAKSRNSAKKKILKTEKKIKKKEKKELGGTHFTTYPCGVPESAVYN
jgi:hypothetical protein